MVVWIKLLEILAACPPDVLNHNLETVPRLYKAQRQRCGSTKLIGFVKTLQANASKIFQLSQVLWFGIGETNEEIKS